MTNPRENRGGKSFFDLVSEGTVKKFSELSLPKLKDGLEFADFSAELDASLGKKIVNEVSLNQNLAQIGELKGKRVYGKTLRDIIKSRDIITSALTMAYRVSDKDEAVSYFVNGEIIGTPEEAEKKGIVRLAQVMRLTPYEDLPGVYVPLLERTPQQQFVLVPKIVRVLGVISLPRAVGPVVGIIRK